MKGWDGGGALLILLAGARTWGGPTPPVSRPAPPGSVAPFFSGLARGPQWLAGFSASVEGDTRYGGSKSPPLLHIAVGASICHTALLAEQLAILPPGGPLPFAEEKSLCKGRGGGGGMCGCCLLQGKSQLACV